MKVLAIILFFMNPDGTVDLFIRPVETCEIAYEMPPNVSYMCLEFMIPIPGEPA